MIAAQPQTSRRPNAAVVGILICGLGFLIGCRSGGAPQRKIDPQLKNHAEAATEAFAEGQLEDAVKQYRKVIRRAWAMDDPLESGNNAYNMAAAMTSMSRVAEARDWLVDARVELYRAGKPDGNTWLLEAKLAQNQCRFDEAARLIQRASCSEPPCEGDSGDCLCGPHDPCEGSCAAKIPCVGEKLEQRKQLADCQQTFQIQIHLAQARWYAEQYDLPNARCHYQTACELAAEICDFELQAELQSVAAMIHLACGQFLQAGWHLDLEAKNLRLAGNYREIPRALELASAAYAQAARPALAADRLCRVARIWYGRGNINRSWKYVKDAIPMAEMSGSASTQIRLALLVHELRQEIDDKSDNDAAPRSDLDPTPELAAHDSSQATDSADAAVHPADPIQEAELLMLEGPKKQASAVIERLANQRLLHSDI
ncbi:hypothetical protein CA51_48570 [Rosistilla oblonga]|uniref:hypothetical protein n=1 Tax=Rosistilla oblonga TaxID=2527990 RepID=UPI00118B0ED9|nr:hypothetical protein [Rosistilla oblonga]QDV14947.1 hypothetical protein CA51_48570 [Rosistilla oblonga]